MKKKMPLFAIIVLSFMLAPFTAIFRYVNADGIFNQFSEFESLTRQIFGNIEIESSEYLYGIDDSRNFVCVDFLENGYAIFHEETKEILEYSLTGDSPYENFEGKKYYAGPACYFKKDGNDFLDLKSASNEESVMYDIPKMDDDLIKAIPPGAIDGGYIPNAKYFTNNPTYGDNVHGTCGSVAVQLLLSYNNYYNDRRIIAPEYLNGGWKEERSNDDKFDANNYSNPYQNLNVCSNPNSMTSTVLGTNDDYYNHVIENIEPGAFSCIDTITEVEYNSDGTTTITVSKKYPDGKVEVISTKTKPTASDDSDLAGTTHSHLGSARGGVSYGIEDILELRIPQNEFRVKDDERLLGSIDSTAIKAEINAGRPLIIGMKKSLGGKDHWVVGYGYQEYTYPSTHPNAGETYSGYVVHTGWGSETNIWVNESWCNGYIALELMHRHNMSIDTGKDIFNVGRELRCEECGYRTADDLYTVSQDGTMITGCNYDLVGDITVPSRINDKTITSIGISAFENQTGITSVSLPYSLTSIGANAFSGCTSLADIYIPSDVTFIGAGVFAGCNNLNLAVSTGNSEYSAQGNILYNKTMTKIISSGNTAANITIPDTVTEVGESAFKDNLKLQRVDIYGTPTIGALAFHKCTNLSKVYFYSYVVPEIGSGAFTDDDFTLYVPHSKQGAYNSIFYGYTDNIDSIPITISFYDDGVVASTLNTYYGAYITGIENPSKVGHDFGGYYDNVDYTGTVYQNGGIWDTTTDMAVYPKWTPKTYLIHFSGEGSENLEDKTVTYGEPIGTMPTVTIIGKTFYGWKNQFNEYFTSDMIWLKLSNQTVESDLRANQYTVTYDGNGGTVSAESMSVFYGSVIESFATAFLDGYTFAGWNTSADGSGQTFTAPYAYEIDEDVTLYAQYTANIYNVSFDKQGGSGGSDGVSVAYDDEMPQGNAVTAPAKVGYTFKGYYRYPNGLGKQYYNADMTSNVVWDLSDDAYLFAHWEAVEYTVTFDKQGGSGGLNSVVAKYGEAMPQGNDVIAPAKVGYTFKGYYRNKNGTGTQYYNAEMKSCNAWNIAENTVIYAFWTPNQYTVLLERNDGTGSVDQITVTYMEDMPAAPLPQYVGYDFRGYYYTSPNGTKIQYYNADMSSCRKWDIADNATLRADKKGKEYEVILNRQGGSGGTTKITVTYGDDMPSAIAPSRTDYNFKGYFSEPNGIGKKYYESNMDSLIKWDEPSGGTLYAHWELKTYTITLILYGNLKDSINVYYGDEIQATYAPARSHYEFVGYYSQPNGVGDCYVKGVLKYEYEIYHIIPESTGKKWYSHGNGTLYAHWKLFETDYSYQVSVEGEADLANRTMHIVSGANTVLNAPSIDGYTFKEWEVNRTTQANGSSYVFELHRSYTSGKIAIYYFNGGPAKYSDGYLCAVYTKDPSCVAAGTMITLADGRQVPVESLTGSERLLVWNLKTGSFDSAPILFIDHDALANYKIINLRFSDGTVVKVIDEHAFWDFDLNKYVFLRKDAAQYIGHWFNKQTTDEGGNLTWTRVQLTNVTLTEEYTTAWSPVTYGHLCIYVNGMLSMPGATEGFVNIFDVDGETMKIDEAQYLADVATYGLFTYEEFAEIYDVPEAIFEAVGGENLKVSIGKGFIDYETLGVLIERYSEFFE